MGIGEDKSAGRRHNWSDLEAEKSIRYDQHRPHTPTSDIDFEMDVASRVLHVTTVASDSRTLLRIRMAHTSQPGAFLYGVLS